MEKMKKLYSKIIVSILLAALLVSSNGCMTQSAIKYAEGQSHQAWINNGFGSGYIGGDQPKPNPCYYFLLPLTIPADIVTSPFQLLGLGLASLFSHTGC
jgi:hypothetical protein